jgi:hypothetical protein
MPINPNIALGIQQPQPVNMLGQMGQMMALKAAQQETEGYEGVRNAITSGMDAGDPRMLQFGKRGIEAFKAAGEGRVKQQDALTKAYLNQRKSLDFVSSPDDLLAHGLSQFKDPVIAPQLKAQGLTPEKLTASFQKQLATEGFESLLKKRAMGLDDWYKDQTSRRNQDLSSGASYGQLELSKKKDAREQAELDLIRGVLTGGVTPPATAPVAPSMGGGGGGGGAAPITSASPVPMGAAPAVAPSVVTQTNVLADQVAPQAAPTPNVNALNTNAQQPQLVQQISQLIRLGTPKALQAADALVKEYNILNPEGTVQQDASGALVTVNKRTNVATPVLDKDGKPVMGDSKYESAFTGEVGKNQATRNEKVVMAAQAASANIQKIDSAIELLKTGDTTTGLGAELRTNVDRARALFAGDIKAGKRVADTQILDALLGSDVFSMIQSLGIGARGLDTPAERDYLRQVMTGTIQMDNKALIRLSEIRRSIETRAIEKYNTQLEKGELNKYFKTQDIKPEKIEIPSAPGASDTMVSTPDGRNIVFPNAAAAAKFRKEAGL